MSVSNLIAAALYARLSGTAAVTGLLSGTGAIYRDQAPDLASLPYVVFNLQAGGPANVYPHDMRSELYQVRAFAARPAQAGSIDTAISAALHKQPLTVTGYTTLWVVRDTDIELAENTPSGEKVYSAGALYRIILDT